MPTNSTFYGSLAHILKYDCIGKADSSYNVLVLNAFVDFFQVG